MNSYFGQSPVFGEFPSQVLSGNGSNTYTLSFKTNSTNGVLVFLNGAVQRPGVDFTCDGTTVTFSENVAVGVQIFVYGMGLPKSTLTTSAGGVGLAELSDEVRAFGSDAQNWANVLKLLTPKGLVDLMKGANQQLSTNGFQKIPGDLIVQHGAQSTTTGGYSTITFPLAFPNEVFVILGSSTGTGATAISAVFGTPTLTNCSTAAISSANAYTTNGVKWVAIGR